MIFGDNVQAQLGLQVYLAPMMQEARERGRQGGCRKAWTGTGPPAPARPAIGAAKASEDPGSQAAPASEGGS